MAELDPDAGRIAALEATRARMFYLGRVQSGRASVDDIFEIVRNDRKGPLRRIRLRSLLIHSGIPAARVNAGLAKLNGLVGTPWSKANPEKITLDWVLDQKTGGRRAAALEEAFSEGGMPWSGYPLAPEPAVA